MERSKKSHEQVEVPPAFLRLPSLCNVKHQVPPRFYDTPSSNFIPTTSDAVVLHHHSPEVFTYHSWSLEMKCNAGAYAAPQTLALLLRDYHSKSSPPLCNLQSIRAFLGKRVLPVSPP